MGENNPFGGCRVFIGDSPVNVLPMGFQVDEVKVKKPSHWNHAMSWDLSADSLVAPDHIVDSLFKQAVNDAIDEAYRVGINIAPTRLPRKAKKWYTRQTKRNQHGMAQYLHILRTNHKELGECVVSNVKRTMEGVEVELTGKAF